MSVTMLGQVIVILNSTQSAVDILDKKSSIHSDRPMMAMSGELVGWKYTLALTPYGDRFREYRRMLHQSAVGSRGNLEPFLPIVELEAHKFLQRVMDSPADLSAEIRR